MKLRLGLPIVLFVALCYFWPSVSDFGWNLYLNNYKLPSISIIAPPKPPIVETVQTAVPALAVTKTKTPGPNFTTTSAVHVANTPVVDHWTVVVIQEVPIERVYVPQAVDAPPVAPVPIKTKPGPDPYDSKTKRGVKAIGRFLKLR
jgi:hypothetical protein